MRWVRIFWVSAALLTLVPGAAVPSPISETQSSRLVGFWKVISLRGVRDLSTGDLVEFTDDGRFISYFRNATNGQNEMHQRFEVNGRRLKIPDGKLDVDFQVQGDRLMLTMPDGFVHVQLRRAAKVTFG